MPLNIFRSRARGRMVRTVHPAGGSRLAGASRPVRGVGRAAASFVMLLGLAQGIRAQELRRVTLADAVSEAVEHSPRAAAARAHAGAQRQLVRVREAFLWPQVGIEADGVRSDDPVAAFGGRLRQGRFTEADFDPTRLNGPDPLTDWSGAVSAAWAPLDPVAVAARAAAGARAEAADMGSRWARRLAAFRAEVAYLRAVGARRSLSAAEAAVAAARADEDRVRRRADKGLLTRADVLQATAAVAAARAAEIDARRRCDDTRDDLSVAMGWPAGVLAEPADTVLPAIASAGVASGDVGRRADLRASAEEVRAARAGVGEASRGRLPRVQVFARLERHAPRITSGARSSWTLGLRIDVPVFSGFALSARAGAAQETLKAARLEHRARLREAAAQLEAAARAVRSAHGRVEAAEAAARAAREAERLLRRRFEEGLATTAELLGAQARAAALEARAVGAHVEASVAAARLRFLSPSENKLPGGENR